MNTTKVAFIGLILSLVALIPNAYAVKNGQKFRDWTAQCDSIDGQQVCGITQTVLDQDKKPMVNIFIRKIEKQKAPIAFIKVPLGVNLRAGLALAVDEKGVAQVPYTVCDPVGCNAIIPLEDELLKKIKKGKKMQIAMLLVNEEIIFSASLSGITKAIESL